MFVYRRAILFLLCVTLFPFFANAQANANQLIWGDVTTNEETGEVISDDRITIIEGRTYTVQLNTSKSTEIKYASEEFYMPRGELYYISDTNQNTREFVKSFYTANALIWEKSGVYELEIYGEAPPFLAIKNKESFWKLALRLIIGSTAHASPNEDVFLGTIRFTITDKDAVAKCTTNCNSNVLFLPGIEGSRLYEGVGCGLSAEEKLWDPVADSNLKIIRGAGDEKVKRLFLNSTGGSVCSDIYTKTDDVIDSVRGNNIYKSFIDEMNGLETDGAIVDWKPVAYDWRLSLTDLLNKGTERDGKIFYTEATSTPYIEQTLRALASSSKTSKVTIVAHSNGGLIAKALLNKLGGETAKSLVDKIILVGAPQSGAPIDIGALLYGMDQGISSWGISVLHAEVARELAENSPMAYHLLPSEDYLESTAGDSAHPVARFAGDAYAKEISAYGPTISNRVELADFLTTSALNSSLIDYGNSQHATLDFWTPPAGIEVSQIAGWGADTVAGIDFYTSSILSSRKYRPVFTEDGDGKVPVPSALLMASSTSVKRYWVDIAKINNTPGALIKYSHRDILEIPSLQNFIKNIIENSTSTLPSDILSSQPSSTNNKKLTFFLHSPLTLQLKDSSGNITGLAEDGSISGDISGATYGEFGDVKYIIAQGDSSYELILHGQDTGSFSLDIQESSGGVITASSTIANVPVTPNTIVSLTLSGGLDTASALSVDVDGNGKNIITLTPKVGETVNYEPPTPAPKIISAGGGNRGTSTYELVIIATTSPIADSGLRSASTTTAATTGPVATSTRPSSETTEGTAPVIATSTKPAQEKKKPSVPIALSKKLESNIPQTPLEIRSLTGQTASVYSASQQPLFKQIGSVVYNSLHSFWLALMRFF